MEIQEKINHMEIEKLELIGKLLEKFKSKFPWYSGNALFAIQLKLEQFELRELEVLVKND